MPLLLIFIVLPMVELWLMIKMGGIIGALPTVLLVIATAMLGVALLRVQGLSALMRAQARMQAGEIPAQELVQGVFLALGGLLLLVPGFFTDAIGFLCLTPGVRHILVASILKRGKVYRFRQPGAPAKTEVIEGEYRRDQ